MKKTIIVYGLIAGIICGGILALSGIMNSGSLNFEYGMYFGFASIILSAVVIWAGISSYKKNGLGGSISFGRALGAGLLMSLIASTIYVFTWMSMYRTVFNGFGEQYAAYEIQNIQKSDKTEAEKAAKIKETEETWALYDSSPVIRACWTYLEILPIQVLVVLIAGAVLSRKKKVAPSA